MAQFRLTLVNKRGSTVITDYDIQRQNTVGLSYDEKLQLSTSGNTLSFSMAKYLMEGSRKVINPLATTLTYGSLLMLETNGHRYDFCINKRDYQFTPDNLIITYSCIDAFQYQVSKIGVGYSISDDTTAADYLGSQSVDMWARKIIRENNLSWHYIDIDAANKTLLQMGVKSLNDNITFSISNSNAFEALKTLASKVEAHIVADYATMNFYFEPDKNPYFKGYLFNPNNNLQQFSLNGDSSSLVTILDVTGPKDFNDKEITLVPSIPLKLRTFMTSPEWQNTLYSSHLYSDYYRNQEQTGYVLTSQDKTFLQMSALTPWLENKLINIDFFRDTNLLLNSEYKTIYNTFVNDLRIVNGELIIRTSDLLQRSEEDYMKINDLQIAIDTANANALADMQDVFNKAKSPTNNVIAPIYVGKVTTTQRVNCSNFIEGILTNDNKLQIHNKTASNIIVPSQTFTNVLLKVTYTSLELYVNDDAWIHITAKDNKQHIIIIPDAVKSYTIYLESAPTGSIIDIYNQQNQKLSRLTPNNNIYRGESGNIGTCNFNDFKIDGQTPTIQDNTHCYAQYSDYHKFTGTIQKEQTILANTTNEVCDNVIHSQESDTNIAGFQFKVSNVTLSLADFETYLSIPTPIFVDTFLNVNDDVVKPNWDNINPTSLVASDGTNTGLASFPIIPGQKDATGGVYVSLSTSLVEQVGSGQLVIYDKPIHIVGE